MTKTLIDALKREIDTFKSKTEIERLKIIRTLSRAITHLTTKFSAELEENDTEASRRKLQKRMNDGNPKPPVKPVTVAEPYKPKLPKYKGL